MIGLFGALRERKALRGTLEEELDELILAGANPAVVKKLRRNIRGVRNNNDAWHIRTVFARVRDSLERTTPFLTPWKEYGIINNDEETPSATTYLKNLDVLVSGRVEEYEQDGMLKAFRKNYGRNPWTYEERLHVLEAYKLRNGNNKELLREISEAEKELHKKIEQKAMRKARRDWSRGDERSFEEYWNERREEYLASGKDIKAPCRNGARGAKSAWLPVKI